MKIKRVVSVNKFNPSSVHTATVTASPESNLSPKLQAKSKPFGDTTSSHVAVVSANLPAPRWPPKPLRRKDIENKPWYEWSFEETTEYYMGDQIREERYESFNKSFVTKITKQADPHTGSPSSSSSKKKAVSATFGGKSPRSVNSSSASTTTALSAMALRKRSSSSNSPRRRGPQSVISSGTRDTNYSNTKSQREDTMSMSSYNTTSRSVINSKQANNNSAKEVAREVRQRHLRVSDLEAEIETVKQQQASLISSSLKGQYQAQRVAVVTEASDQALQALEANSILALAQTKTAVSSLLREQQRRENSVQAMLSEQTMALKRLSIRKSVRTSVIASSSSPPAPSLTAGGRRSSIRGRSPIPPPAPPLLLPAPKITANNLDQYERRLVAENRKSEVRMIVRRGMRRWAIAFLAVRRKKAEKAGTSQTTQLQPAAKKSVRIMTA